MNPPENPYIYLKSDSEAEAFINSLREKKGLEIALDIEGEFNLHRYGEHLCLIQLFDGEQEVAIDPLMVSREIYAPVFEDREIQKIVYDSSSDRTLLFRRYGITLRGVIDLLPAVELLDLPKRGLNNVLARILSLEKPPDKSFQRYDWMRRPLSTRALEYALGDVRYLPELKERLFDLLREQFLLEEYQRLNREIEAKPVPLESVPGLFRKNRFRKMRRTQQEAMKKLFSIRDGYARELDLPPDRVVSNETLFQLVTNPKQRHDFPINPRLSQSNQDILRREFIAVLEK